MLNYSIITNNRTLNVSVNDLNYNIIIYLHL